MTSFWQVGECTGLCAVLGFDLEGTEVSELLVQEHVSSVSPGREGQTGIWAGYQGRLAPGCAVVVDLVPILFQRLCQPAGPGFQVPEPPPNVTRLTQCGRHNLSGKHRAHSEHLVLVPLTLKGMGAGAIV